MIEQPNEKTGNQAKNRKPHFLCFFLEEFFQLFLDNTKLNKQRIEKIEKLIKTPIVNDANLAKNIETQNQKGTQDRSIIKFR